MSVLYSNLGLIIGFLTMTFLIQLFFGDKFAEKSILLILFTMIIINSDEMLKFTKKVNDRLSTEQKRNKVITKKQKATTTQKSSSGGGVGGGGSGSW